MCFRQGKVVRRKLKSYKRGDAIAKAVKPPFFLYQNIFIIARVYSLGYDATTYLMSIHGKWFNFHFLNTYATLLPLKVRHT